MMKNISFASWLALGAALLLALTFVFLPLLDIVPTADAPVVSITGLNVVLRNFSAFEFQLPELLWLGAAVLVSLIGAGLSFLPMLRRTARTITQIAGIAAILSLASVPLFFTGDSDISLAQSLGIGFWLGAFAAILLILQGLIAGKGDAISDSSSEFLKNLHISRKQILAVILVVIGVFSFWEALSIDSSLNSVLRFTAARFGVDPSTSLPFWELPVPSQSSILAISIFVTIAGVLALLNRPNLESITTWLMVFAGILVFPMILIFVSAGGNVNASTIITESFRTATPLAIGAMAGIWCERTGVVNIAIEGMMLTGAAIGFTAYFFLRAWYPDESNLYFHMLLGVIAAVLSGGLIALLHAWLSITFSIDQIISGTVINILAVGTTSYIRAEVLLSNLAGTSRLPIIRIPVLSDLPVIGPIFADRPIFYLSFVLIILTHIILFQTRWGLRTRAVGENPHAADTLGIKVNRMRWINVAIGGMIAGLAGAWLSLEATGRFTDGMTDGKGFISLAAMIFGKWTPAGSFAGAMLFGFSEVMGNSFQILNVALPPQFLQMVPYIVTLIVLAGLVGRAVPPKAVGKPYKKEE